MYYVAIGEEERQFLLGLIRGFDPGFDPPVNRMRDHLIDTLDTLEPVEQVRPFDDFPMSMEYETPGNAGDFHVEEQAQWDDQ